MDNKILRAWLWFFCILSTPFWLLSGVGVFLFIISYPFLIPFMLLKWKRVLTFDEYFRWDFEMEG